MRKESIVKSRVLFEDTDSGQVAYFGRACRWMEMGYGEWFREHVCSLKEIFEKDGVFFVMAEVNIRYLSPLRYDDAISICTRLKQARPASLFFETQIVRDVDSKLVVSSDYKMACIGKDMIVPQLLPQELRAVTLRDSLLTKSRGSSWNNLVNLSD